jgi:hypothetical protein
MSVAMSSAVGRAAGSSWRHAFTARSTSGGHSSGTLRARASSDYLEPLHAALLSPSGTDCVHWSFLGPAEAHMLPYWLTPRPCASACNIQECCVPGP